MHAACASSSVQVAEVAGDAAAILFLGGRLDAACVAWATPREYAAMAATSSAEGDTKPLCSLRCCAFPPGMCRWGRQMDWILSMAMRLICFWV